METPCPVIVMSHGAFGSARNYSWIGEHMARHGFLVLGVSHFRESPIYGQETIDPGSVPSSHGIVRRTALMPSHISSGSRHSRTLQIPHESVPWGILPAGQP